ncbi:MAG: type III pantothenate kinase, partial [Ruthenibacterium sp.]
MVLTIDIGNTNLVMGGYTDGVLVFSTRIATDRSLESDQYALQLDGILHLHGIDRDTLEGAILSSVVPQLTDTLMRALQRITPVEPLLFSQSLHTGVRVKIDRPAELGSDLLAGVIGAKA